MEARFLRASFSAFVDLMGLVTKLVEEYGVTKEGHSWWTIACTAHLWALRLDILYQWKCFRFVRLVYQCICSWLAQPYLEQWIIFWRFMWIQLYYNIIRNAQIRTGWSVVNMRAHTSVLLHSIFKARYVLHRSIGKWEKLGRYVVRTADLLS